MPKLLGHDIPSREDIDAQNAKIESLQKTIKSHHYILAALIGAILVLAIFK